MNIFCNNCSNLPSHEILIYFHLNTNVFIKLGNIPRYLFRCTNLSFIIYWKILVYSAWKCRTILRSYSRFYRVIQQKVGIALKQQKDKVIRNVVGAVVSHTLKWLWDTRLTWLASGCKYITVYIFSLLNCFSFWSFSIYI